MAVELSLTVQDRTDLIGPVYLGSSGNQTGLATFWNASSYKLTAFRAGNATADMTYTLPTAGPAGNGYALISSTTGTMSWLNMSSPTFAGDITITGAGLGLVLTTPDGLHTVRIAVGNGPDFSVTTEALT